MPYSPTAVNALKRVFSSGFAAKDIAEPLFSFDDVTDTQMVSRLAGSGSFDVLGIRHCGVVVGYLEASQITESGTCADFLIPFSRQQIVEDEAPLSEIILALAEKPRLFVRGLSAIHGIITPDDLQKPPVRMWLFGMISLIETRMTHRIETVLQGDAWHEFVSTGRLDKARQLQTERERRGEQAELLDCLQFADKAGILARHPPLRAYSRFQSRREMEGVIRELESLRNNLAHSQDIVRYNGATIAKLAANLQDIVADPDE